MVKHLDIYGYVQGVGFRYQFCAQAEFLGIKGWVRNRRGGRVEAVIAGSPEALDAMISWAQRGPPGARVDRVEVSETLGEFSGFELLPTE